LKLGRTSRSATFALALLVACCVTQSAAAAMPYSDTRPPTSKPARWVIVIHAGGWRLVGRGMTGLEQPEVDRLQGWGYGTVNIDYGRGAAGLTDVLRFERRLRRKVGPRTPICLDGSSAGAHLALMAALRRPDIACVIARPRRGSPSCMDPSCATRTATSITTAACHAGARRAAG
jgi:acetyl esterase/lipase